MVISLAGGLNKKITASSGESRSKIFLIGPLQISPSMQKIFLTRHLVSFTPRFDGDILDLLFWEWIHQQLLMMTTQWEGAFKYLMWLVTQEEPANRKNFFDGPLQKRHHRHVFRSLEKNNTSDYVSDYVNDNNTSIEFFCYFPFEWWLFLAAFTQTIVVEGFNKKSHVFHRNYFFIQCFDCNRSREVGQEDGSKVW